MNIESIKNQLERKNQERNKLIGQEEMILQSLKELGFNSPEEAEKEVKKLTKKIEQMTKKQQEGIELFVKKYGDLLE